MTATIDGKAATICEGAFHTASERQRADAEALEKLLAKPEVPYLAVAAMIAAGLDGIEKGLELRAEEKGNAYESSGDKVPWRLADAVDLWRESAWVAETFGEDVQDHYTNMGNIEIEAFGRTVTDWERYRGFERL